MNEIAIVSKEIGGETVNAVDARELWQALEVGKDFSTWLKDRCEKFGFEAGRDFSPISGKTSATGGRPSIEYIVSIDMAKELCMVENNDRGRQVRRYFIETERRYLIETERKYKDARAAAFAALPDFMNPTIAARAWADEVEKRMLSDARAEEAIRTKSWIGSRREASAMAMASAAVRKVKVLEEELGRGQTYRSYKSIPWIQHYFRSGKGVASAVGRAFARLSLEMGFEVGKAPDSNYGEVNTYHSAVVEAMRARLDRDDNYLLKHRRMVG